MVWPSDQTSTSIDEHVEDPSADCDRVRWGTTVPLREFARDCVLEPAGAWRIIAS